MLLLLVVSLYTSRIVLATLGIEDYGLYNVVGGIVSMFAFISMAMGNSTSRYITIALGKGNDEELNNVVGVACLIHWVLAGIILVLAETVGLWFLHNKMVIPDGRMTAAFWVYQFSIVSCMVSVISVPFNSMIIAHERMGAFAFISILDALLKLLIVFLIQVSTKDRLILYAALLLCVGILNRLIYQVYCRRFFEEAKHIRLQSTEHLGEMTSFAGWSLVGNLAFVGYTQGLNILLNLFFGPVVNAARGVATQVQSVVKGFVTSFQTAINPQIFKSYAQDDFHRLHTLIYSSSKFSFYLLYCLILPIAIEVDSLLGLWLKEVPEGSGLFTILTLFILLVDPLSNPISKANQATGKVKKYQIIEGGSLLLIVPIAYVVLKNGGKPYTVFVVQLIVMYVVQIIRLFVVCHDIRMSIIEYFKQVLLTVLLVAVASAVVPLMVFFILPDSFLSMLLVVIVSVLSVISCAFFLGLTKNERSVIIAKSKEFKKKIITR